MAYQAPEQDIDWSGIRAASVAVGVREAARQAGRDLPPEEQERLVYRVLKRSQREGWVTSAEQAKASVVSTQAKPLSSVVLKGAEIVGNTLVDDSKETRLSLSRGARKMATKLEDSTPDQAGNLLQVAKTAALVHGWENGQQSNVRIAIFTASGDQGPVVDI